MNKLTHILFLLTISFYSTGQSLKLEENWWQPNSKVTFIEKYKNTIYLGGSFSYIGPRNTFGAEIDLNTLDQNQFLAKPNGPVTEAIPDGTGGWYIAGSFTTVSGQARNRLARINSDGSLNNWNPQPNGVIRTIFLYNNIIYLGGDFTQVGSTLRSRICAVDTSGNVTAWDPNANSNVYSILVANNRLYACGTFTSIGGLTRNRIAELDPLTGSALPWNPNANAVVSSMVIANGSMYVGGDFTTIGGQTRNRIACLNTTNNSATNFNPGANAMVYCLHFSNGVLYAGGNFTTVKSVTRKYLAAIDTLGIGTLSSWNPFGFLLSDGPVYTISEYNNLLYVGGSFIKATNQGYIVAIDKSNSSIDTYQTPLTWDGSIVYSISINAAGKMYVGSDLVSIGGANCNQVAAIDAISGKLKKDWASPIQSGLLNEMVRFDSILYLGGTFVGSSIVDGASKLASMNLNTGLGTGLNIPNINGAISTIYKNDNKLYVSGSFTSIDGISRNSFAAIDLATSTVDAFTPLANGVVNDMEITGDTIWAVGAFTSIGGQSRNRIAALNKLSGNAYSWNPNANNSVTSMAMKNNILYAGGSFTTIGGTTRNRIAAIDKTTGLVTSLDLNANNQMNTVTINKNTLYMAGAFTQINSQTKSFFAGYDLVGDSMITTPNVTRGSLGSGDAFYFDDNTSMFGGYFDSTNARPVGYFAAYINPCKTTADIVHYTPMCSGDSVTLYTKQGPEYNYQWLLNDAVIPNSNTFQYKATATGNYRVLVTNTEMICSDTSENISIAFSPRTYAILTPNTDTSFCVYNPFELTVDSDATVTNIKWYRDGVISFGNTSVANVPGSGAYQAVITNTHGCIDTSDIVNVSKNLAPTAPGMTYPGTSTICGPDSLLLRANTKNINLTYQWLLNNVIIPNATDTFIYAKDAGTYGIMVRNVSNCFDTNFYNISKGEKPVINIVSSKGDSICNGQSTIIYYTDTINNPLAFHNWLKNGTSLAGNNPSIIRSDEGIYKLVGRNTIGCTDTSNTLTLVVKNVPAPLSLTGPTSVVLDNTYSYSVPNRVGSTFAWSITKGTQETGGTTAFATVKWTATGNGSVKITETNNVGCEGTPIQQSVSIVQPTLSLSTNQIQLSSDLGDLKTIQLFSNTNWNATAEDSWIEVEPLSGTGNNYITIRSTGPNTTGSTRTTHVLFKTTTLTQTLTVTQTPNVGLEEPAFFKDITIFPNPTSGNFQVNNESKFVVRYDVYDALGKKVVLGSELSSNVYINIKHSLAPGLYFVRLESEGYTKTVRLVISE